ncbi:MAG: hypothetical protein ABIH08_03310 [Candidatus Omnitrophota bacterium]
MKIRTFTKREKLIVYAAAGILIFSLAFNIFSKGFEEADRVNKEIEAKKLLLVSSLRLVNNRENIIFLYQSHRDIFEGEKSLEEIETGLFEETKKLAEKLGLVIENINPLPVKVRQESKQALLEVEMSGELKSIFRFINELETAPSAIKILSLGLHPQSNSSSILRCRMVFSRIFL